MKWEMVKLGDVCTILGGGTPDRNNPTYWNGTIPWVTVKDFKSNVIESAQESITELGLKNSASNLIKSGTIIVPTRMALGKAAVCNIDIAINQDLKAIQILKKNIIDRDFLLQFLISNSAYFESRGKGATVKGITLDILKELYIPLPPLATQRRIAEILDKADALRQKDQALLRKYDELAQAVFVDMFGDPVKNEKGWEVRKLGEVCVKINDGTHFSPPNKQTGIPYITAKHLRKDVVNFFNNPTYISEADHHEIYSRCNPVKGDVLYIKDGATTGIAAVNDYDFEFSMLSSLALIKPNIQVLNSYFLSSWLNNEHVKEDYIKNYMAGAAIRRFTLDKIKRFEILLPPIEVQNKYETIFKSISSQTGNIKSSHSDSLFQSLLQKAFTGELVE